MDQFSVSLVNMSKAESNLKETASNNYSAAKKIGSANSGLNLSGCGAASIKASLEFLEQKCMTQRDESDALGIALRNIIKQYQTEEEFLLGGGTSGSMPRDGEHGGGGRHRGDGDADSGRGGGGGGGRHDNSADEEGGVGDYLLDSLSQILLGNFTDDSNLLGIAGSVALGFVPYVGTAADIRDICGDIYNLFKDGPEWSEAGSLLIDVLAIVPGLDLLKHTDEIAPYLDELVEGGAALIDKARGAFKNVDEVFSKIDDAIDDAGKWVSRQVDKVDEWISPKVDEAMDWVNKQVTKLDDWVSNQSEKTQRFIYKTVSKIPDAVTATKDYLTELTGELIDEYIVDGVIVEGICDYLDETVGTLQSNIENIQEGFEDFAADVQYGFGELQDGFNDFVDGAQEGFENFVDNAQEGFNDFVDGAQEGFNDFVDGMGSAYETVSSGVGDFFSDLFS
ncbi:MAG: hypothetical protein E7263_09120 [Lachnospiraceae bacterium]|nr:hypothetical protein [Lachnospiraceae bacterium]